MDGFEHEQPGVSWKGHLLVFSTVSSPVLHEGQPRGSQHTSRAAQQYGPYLLPALEQSEFIHAKHTLLYRVWKCHLSQTALPWRFEKAVGERTCGTELTVLIWALVGMGKGSNQLSPMALPMAPTPKQGWESIGAEC